MGRIQINNCKLKGAFTVPPSKSLSHRAVICASLCYEGESIIDNLSLSEDIKATIEGMRTLGAEIKIVGNKAFIKRNNEIKNHDIYCGESGSTLRFLIPVALALTDSMSFTGTKKLFERPLSAYLDIFNEHSIDYKLCEEKLWINGHLLPGDVTVPGGVSSQFVSGLLLSLPLLEGNSFIEVVGAFESKSYVDLTLDVLDKFGIFVEKSVNSFSITGNQRYRSCDYTVEGDYSQAAFFLVANELGSDVECMGLNSFSKQGDMEILHVIKTFRESEDNLVIDASQIPDLVPIISVLAALKENCTTTIMNAQRLRIKESDRLSAMSTELNKLGAIVAETDDGLIIEGQRSLSGDATVNSWNDHRIAMALAVAATGCEKNIILENYTAVNKSYPCFWDDYRSLGGVAIELDDRQ